MDNSNSLSVSPAAKVTGRIMVVAIIVLFVVVVFVLFLHLYAKWFWWRIVETNVPAPHRRRRFVFAPGQDSTAAAIRTGLDPSVLRSLPVLVFNPEDFKEGLECAVCLSELAHYEKARLLPKCNHGFHVECIDMWFQSHSTCPLCRNPVAPDCSGAAGEDLEANSGSEYSTENLNFPTNVLFWGNQTQVSSRGASLEDGSYPSPPQSSLSNANSSIPDGVLVIDIPMQLVADQNSAEEELKSPPVLTPTRLRSLKRLLSKEKRVCPCSSSSVEGGEQVGRSQNS